MCDISKKERAYLSTSLLCSEQKGESRLNATLNCNAISAEMECQVN